MSEVEVELDDNGEPVVELETDKVYAPNTTLQRLNPALMQEMVMNYRRAKNPKKLSDFEKASLEGRTWVRPLRGRPPKGATLGVEVQT